MVAVNPNRPVLTADVDFTLGPPNIAGQNRMSLEAPQRRMALRQLQIQRGRQYELDQVQSGTCTLSVVDPTEQLNPQNGSSAFLVNSGNIVPYRALAVQAFWPLTGNIINTGVSVNFDPSFEAGVSTFTAAGGTTLALSTTQHFVGAKSLLVTQGGNTSAAWAKVAVPGSPGLTTTVSIYAWLTGGAHLQIQCADGSTSSILTTQTAWTRLTVTCVQQEAVDNIVFAGTAVATPTFFLDAFQVEFGSSASAFTTTGPVRYPMYKGYIERFPTVYDMSGKRSTAPLTAVDALALFSRIAITQTYDATIAADSPLLYLPLNDTHPPGIFQIGSSASYSTAPTPSATGDFGWAGDTMPDGLPALSLTQKNPATPPAPGTGSTQISQWDVIQGTFSFQPGAGLTVEAWVKVTSGLCTPIQVAVVTDGVTFLPDQQYIQVTSLLNGLLQLVIRDTVSGQAQQIFSLPLAGQGFADGQWHYVAVTIISSTQYKITYDSTENGGTLSTGLAGVWGVNNVHFDAYSGWGSVQSQMSIARVAVYTKDITPARRQAHYSRGNCNIGELSGTRVRRMISAYWSGNLVLATGYAHMATDGSYNTRTLLDVLEEIQDTERGLLYVDTGGNVVFEDRTTRYNSKTSLWTLGENPTGASPTEYPYIGYQADFDPTYTFTQCNLSRPDNSAFAPVVNATTTALYGQRILTQTVQVTNDFDLTQAATFYLARYGTPKPRISKVTLDPAANPALWPLVLGLDISQRLTIKRRSDALSTSNDYYVEQITHNINSDTGAWTVDLQMSPVFNPVAWFLGDATYGVLGTTTVPIY